MEVIDTAGCAHRSRRPESAGMARAQAVFEQAELVVWLLNGASTPIFPTSPISAHVCHQQDRFAGPVGLFIRRYRPSDLGIRRAKE